MRSLLRSRCIMPCPCLQPQTEDEIEARSRTKLIDRELKEDHGRLKREVKLLLLGAGASGKSTFVRQMRIIHGNGFGDEERGAMRTIIYDNVISAAQSLVSAMTQLELAYESEERRNAADRVSNIVKEGVTEPVQFAGIIGWIMELWADAGVKACYERRNEYELLDSCEYYMSNLKRLAEADYQPTEHDIVRCRSPTLSILEYPFELSGIVYRIVDVGGQRPERRKWMFCFEGVTSVIFLAALSEYTRLAEEEEGNEDQELNALVESQILLALIMRSKYLTRSSFILFLNKSDIFEERIRRYNLCDYIPSYMGPARNADAAYDFIEQSFLDCVPEERTKLKQKRKEDNERVVKDEPLIYCHRTTATNTDNIRRIFNAVKDTILETFLKDFNIV